MQEREQRNRLLGFFPLLFGPGLVFLQYWIYVVGQMLLECSGASTLWIPQPDLSLLFHMTEEEQHQHRNTTQKTTFVVLWAVGIKNAGRVKV